MKTITRLSKLATAGIIITAFAVNFNACTESSPLSPADNDKNSSLEKKGSKKDNNAANQQYPQSASFKALFDKSENEYEGVKMEVENGSIFKVHSGSIMPPESIKSGKPVTLTMDIDKRTGCNELVYTFGPSGTTFTKSAEIIFDWNDLGVKKAELFYIDSEGNRIKQKPDHIDMKSKKMTIYVDHFSRYAVAWSN